LPAVKRFTPAEASRTLPLVKKIVNDILSAGSSIKVLYDEGAPDNDVEQVASEIDDLLSELKVIGCEYKDFSFNIGLIDFPSVIDDRDVYLCWKSDEPSLKYYHGIHEGFAGRKLIPAYLLEETIV
jgi:hypothetical protein